MSKPKPEIEEVVSEEESDEEEKKCLCGSPEQEYDRDGDNRDYARYLFCNYLYHDTVLATEDDFEESYRGYFNSPEDFAKELVEDCYDLKTTLPWFVLKHLDWDGIADELMADYWEDEGHYFRRL